MNVFFLLVVFMIVSCGNTSKESNGESFVLRGQLKNPDFENKKVYLSKPNPENPADIITLDSGMVSKGKFLFKGSAEDLADIRFVMLGERNEWGKNPISWFIAEPGEIEIVIDKKFTVKGTELNDRMQQVTNRVDSINKEMEELVVRAGIEDANKVELAAKSEFLKGSLREEYFEFLKTIITTPAGEYLFETMRNLFTKDQFLKLVSMGTPEMKERPKIKELSEKYNIQWEE